MRAAGRRLAPGDRRLGCDAPALVLGQGHLTENLIGAPVLVTVTGKIKQRREWLSRYSLNCGSSLGHHCKLLGVQFFSCLVLAVREIFLDL